MQTCFFFLSENLSLSLCVQLICSPHWNDSWSDLWMDAKRKRQGRIKKIGYASHENEITKPNIIQYPLCARHCVGAVKGKEVSHAWIKVRPWAWGTAMWGASCTRVPLTQWRTHIMRSPVLLGHFVHLFCCLLSRLQCRFPSLIP